MCIVRTSITGKKFTVAQNEILESPDMNWDTKGLLCYLIGRPKNWKIYVPHLVKIYNPSLQKKRGSGEKAIRRMLKEMENAGYASYTESRNEKGQYQKNEGYTIYDTKQEVKKQNLPKELKKCLPYAVKRHAVKRRQTITNDNQYVSKKTYTDNQPIPPKRNIPPTEIHKDTAISSSEFDSFKYRLKDGQLLTLRTSRAFAKYNYIERERLINNIIWYEEQIDKGIIPKTSHEQMLQWAIKNNMAGKEENKYQNFLYVNYLKEENKLKGINILKTVVQLSKFNNSLPESISLELNHSQFCNVIDDYVRFEKSR